MAIGMAKILTKLHEIKQTRQYTDQSSMFVAGRVHGMIQALSFLYNVSCSEAKKILFDE